MAAYWKQLDTRFPQVEEVFEDCMAEALAVLSREGLDAYLEAGRVIGKLGRGEEPMLAFLEEWPSAAKAVGEPALPAVMVLIQRMQKSPNGRAIAPFLQTLAPVARRLQSQEQLQLYLDITLDFMERTTGSIHGHHTTFPSPGLPEFLAQAPNLLSQLTLAGLKNWVEYGIRNYGTHPERQKDYLQPAVGRQPCRAAARTPRHPAGGRRAQAGSVPARPVAGRRPPGAVLHRVRRNPQADSLLRQARHPPAGCV